MARIFILEDDAQRITYMLAKLGQHDLTVIDSCADIRKFQPPYDLLLLDHDLGGFERDHTKDNGQVFCEAIADKVGDTPVVIHSWNPDGAKRMHAILPHAVIAQFGSREFDAIISQLPYNVGDHHSPDPHI